MIITDLTALSESWRRLFRKKRMQLMRRTSLKRIKHGVYLIHLKKIVLSKNELEDFRQIWDLIREFHVKANYFMVTRIKPQDWVEGNPFKNGKLDVARIKNYFVLEPIKILEE